MFLFSFSRLKNFFKQLINDCGPQLAILENFGLGVLCIHLHRLQHVQCTVPISQSIKQSINQLINQSVNQSINVLRKCWKMNQPPNTRVVHCFCLICPCDWWKQWQECPQKKGRGKSVETPITVVCNFSIWAV